jgi:FkbM family methyltransferase
VISYAQNAEDVVLARLFAGQATGRYVDLGAGDPVEDSVTKHFYDLGWRGLNVEPSPAMADRIRAARPDDVTVAVAIGAKPGTAMLHIVPSNWGRSTLDGDLARKYRDDDGWDSELVEVPVVTLADLLNDHPGEIDFLKIDVEGAEHDVIEGADWQTHRPRVVVVEATEPGAPIPSHQSWEPILVAADYRCALFDGLNRFYAKTTDTEAITRLSAPANVFDDFRTYATEKQATALTSINATRAAEAAYIRRLEASLSKSLDSGARDGEYLTSLEATIEALRTDAAKAHRYSAALENRVTELENLLAAKSKHRADPA